MDEHVLRAIQNWKRVRKLTYDLVKSVPVEMLNKRVGRPIYDSMAKQIYELSIMQRNYTNVLDWKEPDFSKAMSKSFRIKESADLTMILKTSDEYFFKVAASVDDWYSNIYEVMGRRTSAYNVLAMMTEHETFHQGQFAALGYMLGIKFPKSWQQTWVMHLS